MTTPAMRKAGAQVIFDMLHKDNWIRRPINTPLETCELWAHVIWTLMQQANPDHGDGKMPTPSTSQLAAGGPSAYQGDDA
jgi:hypothetical protein